MADTDFTATEHYVQRGYRRWSTMAIPFDYKERKGARLVEILQATGGLPLLALEIGIGPGGVAKAVSSAGPHVLGMDLSPEGLLQARRHCGAARVSLLQGSGFALPFVDGSLPVVYASQVLHIFDAAGRLAVMREVRRVLRPGGRFVFDMKNLATHPLRFLVTAADRRARNFPPPRQLAQLLSQAGFSGVEIRAGLFPLLGAAIGCDAGPLRWLAHTRFYVARA